MLMGIVSELAENSFILTFGEEVYQVNADAALLAGIQDGMFVTVYHTGMMTRSLPAQVVATHIRGQEIVGIVTEMVEGGFTLTVEGEEIPYHVAIKENALQFVQVEPGMEIIVITDGLMTSSLESILVNAVEILPLPYVEEIFDMAGTVTEIGEGFIMIQSAEGQMIQVNTFEETIFEGKEIAVGDFIHVTYNGMMTFSIPAQIAAQKVGCYAHTGVIGEITEGQFTLETEMEMILVNAAAEQLEGIEAGMTVTVYYNGASTRSIPPQITAEHIRTMEMTGTIVEMTETGFLMVDESGIQTMVHLSDATAVFTELTVDAAIRVTTDGTATMSLPAQVTAIEILPVITAEEVIEDSAEETVIEG